MTEYTMVEAIALALQRAMIEDDSVVLLGEDVAKNGGVFRASEGLYERFGANRVIDTPLAETLIAGLAVGLGAQGMKPVAEIQFMGFIYPTLDQIINHASRLRTRTRGRLSCPMVLRAPYGAGIRAPEHHSESTEALFAHIPGLRVIIPASPKQAYGLLLAAIRDPDPVVLLEPKRIYRGEPQALADDGAGLPLDRCFMVRRGRDISLISWGAMLVETLAAADQLATEGISCEVIDVACLKPLDTATLLQSVATTGRAVIVQEAADSGGFASHIAAVLADEGLLSLLAPIKRVSGFDTIVPLPRLEQVYLPSIERIVDTARATMAYT